MNPRVTVLMPVYNGERYLKEAVKSILAQSYTDFELLIINDGSTDRSAEIIKSFSDKRIQLIINERNIGQAETYNKGIKIANGNYIALMHADDISLPDRLQKQVAFMDANPELGISGTWVKLLTNNKKNRYWQLPIDPDMAMCPLLFHVSMVHPTIIMRRNLIISNNLYYNPSCETAEDYDLFLRASRVFPITNLGEILLHYRMHPDQVSSKNVLVQNRVCKDVRIQVLNLLGISPDSEEFYIHNLIGDYQKFSLKQDVVKALAWLEKLDHANKQEKIFPIPAISEYLADKWFYICYNASQLGTWAMKKYYESEYSSIKQLDLTSKGKFFLKCVIRYK
jgi:glycosyltransferase involved in cell wall biosynthesis